MQEDQPSKTAHRVAVRRAIHQIWDEPRIFDDPLALKILDAAEAAEIAATKPSNSLPSSSLRAFIVARSRYAEDNLADSVQRNVKQYVILGAGLDTLDRKSTRLNSSHANISYAVFCLKKKNKEM